MDEDETNVKLTEVESDHESSAILSRDVVITDNVLKYDRIC
jgi:hypothetical protein